MSIPGIKYRTTFLIFIIYQIKESHKGMKKDVVSLNITINVTEIGFNFNMMTS